MFNRPPWKKIARSNRPTKRRARSIHGPRSSKELPAEVDPEDVSATYKRGVLAGRAQDDAPENPGVRAPKDPASPVEKIPLGS